jgi:hypothetical protein
MGEALRPATYVVTDEVPGGDGQTQAERRTRVEVA